MLMRRKSTGKRLRFEVFKRDHVTCQYCGAQPPDVVLVADHITPVAEGGETSIDNLLTACTPCNQGKADKALGARQIRPDADVLFLETQQEIAELQRYTAAVLALDMEVGLVVKLLQDRWVQLSGLDWSPSARCVRQLLATYSPEIVEAAMVDVAVKVESGYLPARGNRWVGYLFTVARTIARESEYGADEA